MKGPKCSWVGSEDQSTSVVSNCCSMDRCQSIKKVESHQSTVSYGCSLGQKGVGTGDRYQAYYVIGRSTGKVKAES